MQAGGTVGGIAILSITGLAMYWLSPLADPDDFVGANYNCDQSINVQKSCDPAMTDILLKAKTAVTPDERKALYKQQQELLARSAATAQGGKTEHYKISHHFDGTIQNPQWLTQA